MIQTGKKNGVLEGLSPEHEEIVIDYLQQIDLNKFKDLDIPKDCQYSIAEELISPVIRYMLIQIIDAKNVKCPTVYGMNECLTDSDYFHKGVTEQKLLNEFNVQEITDLIIEYANKCIPVVEKCLPNIDSQAEMAILFCKNYLMKIYDKVLNEKTEVYKR